jgi:hypothetical protein
LKILLQEIIFSIEEIINSKQNPTKISQKIELGVDENKILVTLSTLHILIDNCPKVISNDHKKIALLLLLMNQVENLKIRICLSNCWNSLIILNKEIFFEISDQLFSFFLINFNYKNYDLNFSSAEFFYHILYGEEISQPCDKLQKLMELRINE